MEFWASIPSDTSSTFDVLPSPKWPQQRAEDAFKVRVYVE